MNLLSCEGVGESMKSMNEFIQVVAIEDFSHVINCKDLDKNFCCLFVSFSLIETEHKTLDVLGKCSTIKLFS